MQNCPIPEGDSDRPTAPLIVASLSLTFFALLVFKHAIDRTPEIKAT